METLKTFSLKQKEINKTWLLIDADGLVLGRLASFIAKLLKGKHKPTYTPHLDCGDNVIVVNAKKIKLKGKKFTEKIYYKHTGYPGGIKRTNPEKMISGKNPEEVIRLAVKRMLSNNKLSRDQMKNLRIFPEDNHDLNAQKPEIIDFANMNKKNK
tara:strand:- start:1052 stop:1516 length:465 start_codon:yes stop_codon:yes gene_type:complete